MARFSGNPARDRITMPLKVRKEWHLARENMQRLSQMICRPWICAFAVLACGVAGVPNTRATTHEGEYPPLSRITGTIVIRTKIDVASTTTEQSRARNEKKLQGIWEDRTYPRTTKMSLFVLSQLLRPPPYASKKFVEYKRFEMRLNVVVASDEVESFKRRMRNLSRIRSVNLPIGKIRWTPTVCLSVTPESAP